MISYKTETNSDSDKISSSVEIECSALFDQVIATDSDSALVKARMRLEQPATSRAIVSARTCCEYDHAVGSSHAGNHLTESLAAAAKCLVVRFHETDCSTCTECLIMHLINVQQCPSCIERHLCQDACVVAQHEFLLRAAAHGTLESGSRSVDCESPNDIAVRRLLLCFATAHFCWITQYAQSDEGDDAHDLCSGSKGSAMKHVTFERVSIQRLRTAAREFECAVMNSNLRFVANRARVNRHRRATSFGRAARRPPRLGTSWPAQSTWCKAAE